MPAYLYLGTLKASESSTFQASAAFLKNQNFKSHSNESHLEKLIQESQHFWIVGQLVTSDVLARSDHLAILQFTKIILV